jgi:hypothetical protein
MLVILNMIISLAAPRLCVCCHAGDLIVRAKWRPMLDARDRDPAAEAAAISCGLIAFRSGGGNDRASGPHDQTSTVDIVHDMPRDKDRGETMRGGRACGFVRRHARAIRSARARSGGE